MPYSVIVIAALVCAALSFAGGAYLGYDYARGDEAKRIADAQNKTLDRAREDAAAAIIAMADAARQAGLDEAAARAAKNRGVSDAQRKANPACVRDAESIGLLNAAIDAANGHSKGAAGSVPSGVPAGAEAGKRF